jgi:hypothetical protein
VSAGRDDAADDGSRERRLARNEAFFREANEIIERDAERRLAASPPIICECSQVGCMERVRVVREEYERVRSRGDWFIVTPGHEDLTIEGVMERHPGFVVVQKFGVAGTVARDEDPRERD